MLVAKRYRLGPSLGRGGMGEVFRATDELLGRPVAVKLLLPTDRDPRAADRFHREARAAAMLNDPHLVAVYDFGRHDDGFFLVMELVEGGTVAGELAEHGTLSIDRALEIVEQSAAGLAVAHRQDVVHRDVKPGNLLLATDRTVKVADFGIAQVPSEGTTTLTAAGEIIGSALYLSPERARGEQAGKAADVYALGCVLYQLVTGQPPFTAEHPTGILYQHVDTPPVPPSTIRPEFGEPYEGVLLRMLAKDPADRPTAAEIAAGALRTAPAAGTTPVVVAPPPTEPISTIQQTPPDPNRRRALVIGAIALVIAAATGVGLALLNNDNSKLPATNDVGPRPSVSTPATTTQPSTPNQSTSTQPTQSPSTPATPTPSTPSPTSTPSSNTPSPSPSEPSPSTTPSPSTSPSPSPSATPSSSPSPQDPPTNTPPANTPTPETQGKQTPPPRD